MERDGIGGFEVLVLAVGFVAAGLVGIVWAGAVLGSVVGGRPASPGLPVTVDALGRLPSSFGNPASAWPEPYAAMLPGPAVYWSATALPVFLAVVAGAVALRWWGRRSRVGTTARRPLGVDARPRFAGRRDLAPLLVKAPAAGRFVVARFGRWLVATEAASEDTTVRRRAARLGDRGAVALIGPSRSGKTTAAVGGILEWEGPAVLSSVKADLLASTRGWRSRLGAVRVYDPTSSTVDATESARWSPLEQAATVIGAQRAARALCDAAPRGGVEGGMDFWLAQAEILLSGLLYVAHHVERDMGAVCEWVLLQDHPGELGPGEVRAALDHLLTSGKPAVVAGALEASKGLVSVWEMEERTRSSIYATAQTVVWPWSDPTTTGAGTPCTTTSSSRACTSPAPVGSPPSSLLGTRSTPATTRHAGSSPPSPTWSAPSGCQPARSRRRRAPRLWSTCSCSGADSPARSPPPRPGSTP